MMGEHDWILTIFLWIQSLKQKHLTGQVMVTLNPGCQKALEMLISFSTSVFQDRGPYSNIITQSGVVPLNRKAHGQEES